MRGWRLCHPAALTSLLRVHHESTGRVDHLSRYPSPLLRREKRNYVRRIFGSADSSERSLNHTLLFDFGRHVSSLCRARTHDVGRDSVFAHLFRSSLCVADKSSLASRIADVGCVGKCGRQRDNAAPLCFASNVAPEVVPHHESRRPSVDGKVSVDAFGSGHTYVEFTILLAGRIKRFELAVGMVDNQDIHPTELAFTRIQQSRDIVGLPEVEFLRGSLTMDFGAMLRVAWPILWPMLVGSVPVGIVTWLAFYVPLRRLISGYQSRRLKNRLRRKAEQAGFSGMEVPNGS